MAYVVAAQTDMLPDRERLTPDEEYCILGQVSPQRPRPHPLLVSESRVNVPECPVPASYVPDAEKALSALAELEPLCGEIPPYPLSETGGNALAWEMHKELKESWETHHRISPGRVAVVEGLEKRLKASLEELRGKRVEVESYVMFSVECSLEGHLGRSIAAMRAGGVYVVPKMADLIRGTWDDSVLEWIAPLLDGEGRERVRNGVLRWMELCVLEDRLERLREMKRRGEGEEALARELRVSRVWDVREHPRWLAFEVEGRLQIRPQQYDIAHAMINDLSGGIFQVRCLV